MSEKDFKNCWEYWNCEPEVKEKCPAFLTNSGADCWDVAGSYKKHPTCPKIKGIFTACWQCPWFQKLNPDFDKK